VSCLKEVRAIEGSSSNQGMPFVGNATFCNKPTTAGGKSPKQGPLQSNCRVLADGTGIFPSTWAAEVGEELGGQVEAELHCLFLLAMAFYDVETLQLSRSSALGCFVCR
jgi:hypothetical protein